MIRQPGNSNGKDPEQSEQSENKPSPRLSSFRLPRDLTLGANAPPPPKTNKKVFTPNLNVTRNKNKTAIPNLAQNNKKDGKNKKDKQRNNKKQNGPSIIKSSGVFSEGLGSSERHNTRAAYSRDNDCAPSTLQKPVLRQKTFTKVDKEEEDLKIKRRVFNKSNRIESSEDEDESVVLQSRDAPLRLPISAGGTLYSAKKLPSSTKLPEVVVKQEPGVDDELTNAELKELKTLVGVSPFDATDVVKLLSSEKPTMMLLQLPDNLPGRGSSEDDAPRQNTSIQNNEKESKMANNTCRLSNLDEGRIGKILIHKSGKVKLVIGDTHFDLSIGTQPCFRQDAVSVAVDPDARTGAMINLGAIESKITVIPDWEAVFKDVFA